MTKIILDAGHGKNTKGKRSPDDEREWSFNDLVARHVTDLLKDYKDVEVRRADDPTGETDVPLGTRAKLANDWRADVYTSIHMNADKGVYGNHTGTETYHYPGSETGKKLAQSVHPQLISKFGLRDRGIKTADFQVLRDTNMPAILIEGGFMDSNIDILALRDNKRMKALAEGIVLGLEKHLNLKRKEVVKVTSNAIELTPGQQKAKDSLVKHGLMAANYEVKDPTVLTLITMLAPLVDKLEAKGSI